MSLPNDLPEWAINNTSLIEVPGTVFANQGYGFKAKPSSAHFNFILNRLIALYNAAVNGDLNDGGINAVSQDHSYDLIFLKGKVEELEIQNKELEYRIIDLESQV